jgi:hypothetical protein
MVPVWRPFSSIECLRKIQLDSMVKSTELIEPPFFQDNAAKSIEAHRFGELPNN